MKFFSPTAEYKELLLLQHIEHTPDTSQHEIARVIGSAASMVNVYVNKLEDKGYLIRQYYSLKIVHYNITPQGVKRKNYLLISYMKNLLDLYKLAKENVEVFLSKLELKGYSKVLIYGAGEVAETLLDVIKSMKHNSLEIVAVIDDDELLQGSKVWGYRVIAKEEIKDYDHDGIVITSYTFEDEIMSKLREIGYPEENIERFFTEEIKRES